MGEKRTLIVAGLILAAFVLSGCGGMDEKVIAAQMCQDWYKRESEYTRIEFESFFDSNTTERDEGGYLSRGTMTIYVSDFKQTKNYACEIIKQQNDSWRVLAFDVY